MDVRPLTVAIVLTAVTLVATAGATGVVMAVAEQPIGLPRSSPSPSTAPKPIRLDGSNAAREALQCDHRPDLVNGESEPWSTSDGGSTPRNGLKLFFEIDQPGLPTEPYRLVERNDHRAMYTYQVDGRVKIAVLVAKDRPRRPGWGPYQAAACNEAEFPAAWTAAKGIEVWTDRDGDRVPTSTVVSQPGPAHCHWAKARFLTLHGATYAIDPQYALPEPMLPKIDGLRAGAWGDLPDDARDTGYRLGRRQLWSTPDRRAVYLLDPAQWQLSAQVWPRVADGFACK